VIQSKSLEKEREEGTGFGRKFGQSADTGRSKQRRGGDDNPWWLSFGAGEPVKSATQLRCLLP